MYYKLNKDKSISPCNLEEWSVQVEQFHHGNDSLWRVGENFVDEKRISTVFLGIDHGYIYENKTPILFETMIFDDNNHENYNDYQKRYCNYEQALEGHQKAVDWVKNGCKEEERI